MSAMGDSVEMLRRDRLAVLDRLLTELEEVNLDPCADVVPMDLLSRLNEQDVHARSTDHATTLIERVFEKQSPLLLICPGAPKHHAERHLDTPLRVSSRPQTLTG